MFEVCKLCPICKVSKPLDEFHNSKSSKDGRFPYCKICASEKSKKWMREHKEQRKKYQKEYEQYKKENFPELFILDGIKQRCNNPNNKRFKNYGLRGIQCLITTEEIKQLMVRDNYWSFNKPSIDRIDNDGDYTFNNCRFIEFNENSGKDKRRPIFQYDLEGNFIKEFISTIDAERQTGFSHKCIGRVALGKRKASYGYIWKYKEDIND